MDNNSTTYRRSTGSEGMFLGLIVFFGLMLGYLIYSNTPPAENELPQPAVPPDQETREKISQLQLNFSLFDHLSFDQLKIFGEVPVQPGEVGKENPFAPF